MAIVFAFVFVLVSCFAGDSTAASLQENNTYIILGPKAFRPGMMYKVQVSVLKASSAVQVIAGILEEKTRTALVTGSGSFTAGTPGHLEFQVPFGVGAESIRYVLSVNASGGLEFQKEVQLQFKQKGLSIYVQTDKGIYKPGQTVHMRVFAVYPDLKVYNGSMTVDVLDPNNNKMVHWVDLESSASGVIKKDFPISAQPVLGNWKISVLAEAQKKEQIIEIKEYVLPKFEVTVNIPSYLLKRETHLQGSISVKYTYGKGVKGVANVACYFPLRHDDPLKLAKDINVDENGHGSFSFSKNEIVSMFGLTYGSWAKNNPDYLYKSYYYVTVNATFKDALTQREMFGEAKLNFYENDVKLTFPDYNPKTFKPGLEYIAQMKVTKPDDTALDPAKLSAMRITINTNYKWGGDVIAKVETPSADGTIQIKRQVPDDAETVHIKAEYKDGGGNTISRGQTADKADSPSNSFIQLSTETPSVKAGEQIKCSLRATFSLLNVKYMVLSRGNIVMTGTHSPSSGSKETTFTIQATHGMAPTARLLVYVILQSGEVIVDSLNIEVAEPFENKVSLEFRRQNVRPGDQVTLVGKATPGSHMAFLAVDKSVLLMKKDNDISAEQVNAELQSFDSADSFYAPWLRRFRRSIMPFPTSGRDAASVFQNSGVVVVTNCFLFENPRLIRHFAFETAGIQESAADGFVRKNSAGAAPDLAEVERVRSFFPETWIWRDAEVSDSGEVVIPTAVPDTITSWVASAFALSSSTGFGVSSLKPKLEVFQPFFLSLDLPYSVVRGEEVAIKAIVFNYLEEPQEVTVTLKASKQLQPINELAYKPGQRGMDSNDNYQGAVEEEAVDVKTVVVIPAGQGKAVSFPVIPRTLGNIPITVQAQSSSAADAVKRNLLVEAEGVPQEYSYSLLLDLNTTSSLTRSLELSLPPNTVTGSATAKVSVIGDLLGSSINNLDDLLRMPYGCGEQNMVNFAPNIFIMKYLKTVNQLTSAIKNKAENFMISGYQREQTYRHKEGSYSAFGERDEEGSMWLTAFVAKSFAQAQAFIPQYIDGDMLQKSLEWMANQQNSDGSFPRRGSVHSSSLKGGLKDSSSLTAFVLISLAEAKSNYKVVTDAKDKATSFLKKQLEDGKMNDEPYTLAITTYALTLVDSDVKDKARKKLRALATEKDGLMFWTEDNDDKYKDSAWTRPYYKPRSADIEITAYALMSFTLINDVSTSLTISRWLAEQRNSMGGYASTQDTVVGLQALSEFAAEVYSPSLDFDVLITSSVDPAFRKTFDVNAQNFMVLQQAEISKVGGALTISANGHGIGMLQVGVTYNLLKAPSKRSFDFDLDIVSQSNNEIEAKACAKWTENDASSGMAVLEVGIPSGFTPDMENIEKALSDKKLKLKRVDKLNQKVALYFDEIPSRDSVCVNVRFERAYDVGKSQPVPAVIYDYYHPENVATAMYAADSLADKGVCEVCPSCVNCKPCVNCGQNPGGKPSGSQNSSGPCHTIAGLFVSVLFTVALALAW